MKKINRLQKQNIFDFCDIYKRIINYQELKIFFRVVPKSCNEIRTDLINQMDVWKGDNCPGISDTCPSMPCGQKCLYIVSHHYYY